MIAFVSSSHRDEFSFAQLFSFSLLFFFAVYIGLFYFNTLVLVPKLYLKKKYLPYIIALISILLVIIYFKPFDSLIARPYEFSVRKGPPPFDGPGDFKGRQHHDGPGGPPPGQPFDIVSVVLFLMLVSLGTVSSLVKKWRESEKKAAKAEAEKAQAELSFLKTQINPHFLFNTLNNIYSLIVTKNELAPEAVMKLSNIMRYVTDDVSEDFVPLEKEIACARDYIDLQKIRLNQNAEIDFKTTAPSNIHQIAPLIFMSFIENIFKYGISSHEHSPVTIHITMGENSVTLYCRNKIFPNTTNLERAGIGISNTRQRLEHLYPNKHLLLITQENGFYTVQLTVQK
jgi:hypothetical protein